MLLQTVNVVFREHRSIEWGKEPFRFQTTLTDLDETILILLPLNR